MVETPHPTAHVNEPRADKRLSGPPPSRLQYIVATLCKTAAIYGIMVGVWSLPTGLFVGPQILAAALAHIAIGVLFWLAYTAMRRSRAWGLWLTCLLALACSALGSLAVYQGYVIRDTASLVFWGSFTFFFTCLAVLAIWQGVGHKMQTTADSTGGTC